MTSTHWWTIGIIGIIVIVGGYWYLDRAYASTLVTNDNAVLLQDQKPGTDTVVTYAKLSKPGYVVIYSTSTAGEKTVAGQSDLLTAGEHRDVHVHTTGTQVASGGTIVAAVVADNGDGTYDANDTEVLAGDDAAATAEVSDTASLDESPSDADLAKLLDEAGYDLSDSAQADADTDTMMPEDGAMMHDDASTTDDAMMQEGSSTDDMMQGDSGDSGSDMMHGDEGAMMNETEGH
ncbi:MAG TPA: hypothetical protein VHB93_00270 [Candidatus Paceibacterota bacterium]|nr:hypothetical protein [Candidatus Paceibacterota bacterium]